MPSAERAKEIISKIIYMTIASVSKDGQPWNTPVYCAFDEVYNFYWASWKENQHSKNIAENQDIFIVIYDSAAPEGTGEGVYIKAKAQALTDPKDIEQAAKYTFGRKGGKPRKPEEYLGDYPRRMYKAIPEKFWMNGDGDIDGNYIDVRVEIKIHV
ncbi:pyridoxamine 5'-phosphate oxidase family protein [Acetobacteraceae bacterium]|nr:pyridoxamine 5'-phosphate oxidase family protein [Candidatus Parcubacteria bacterium]